MHRALALAALALSACTNTVTSIGDLGPADLTASHRDFAGAADLTVAGELGADDLASPSTDLAGVDFAGADLAALDDLAAPRDLGAASDLSQRDLAAPRDLGAASDLSQRDLRSPADLACNPALCSSPPADDCQGATARAFPNPGVCDVGGSCAYPPTSTPCTFGCYRGACSGQLSFIGNRAAFQTGTANTVGLVGGSAPSTNSVSVIVQTYPHGAAQMVQLFYTTNDFASTTVLTMLPDPNTPPGNNDQWYAIIPAQAMGTHVIWYLLATGWDGTQLYDSNLGGNYDYTSN